MRHTIAHLLVSLYPASWRARYGAEFEALLEDRPASLRISANVVWAAFVEHILASRGVSMDPDTRSSALQAWCDRAPWAIFSVAPLLLLACAYGIACVYLWSGWNLFLPGADTPFGSRSPGPVYGLANLYFQLGKFYYFCAPILAGWAVGLMAARQRAKAGWPGLGLVLVAWIGASARIQASRTAIPQGLGHVRMYFALWPSIQDLEPSLIHAAVIFSFAALPYLLWRLRKVHSVSV